METSKKWGLRSPTKSERNHNELFCRHQIFNMLKICQRTRRIISAVCGRYRIRQRQLTATHDDWRQIQNCNSQLNVACRYPLFVIVWARLTYRTIVVQYSKDRGTMLAKFPMTTYDRENRKQVFGHFQNPNCNRFGLAILREQFNNTLPLLRFEEISSHGWSKTTRKHVSTGRRQSRDRFGLAISCELFNIAVLTTTAPGYSSRCA